jgi:hypothetical protein
VLQRLLPSMRSHEYIGAEYEPQERLYRLKFLRNGQVSWIDVDAKSARVRGRALPPPSR